MWSRNKLRDARQPRIVGAVVLCPLKDGTNAIVDAADLGIVHDKLWTVERCRKAERVTGYVIGLNRKLVLSRLIVSAPANMVVDHIDGDIRNNRRNNLRLCTRAENNRNVHKIRTDSGFKGVSWSGEPRKWHARIKVDRRTRHLGYFCEPSDAARAYDAAALKYFGEFARTNESLGRFALADAAEGDSDE